MYGNFTHVFFLIMKERNQASYRRLVEMADENGWTRMLGIKKVPHFSTIQKFLQRINKQVFRRMVRACAKLINAFKVDASIDGTGFSLTNPSAHYLKRINGSMPKVPLKTSIIVDNKRRIVLNVDAHADNRHDNRDFLPLVKEIKNVLEKLKADKGYDAEVNIKYCRKNNIAPQIPIKLWKQAFNGYGLKPRIGGKNRRWMYNNFDETEYHQRSIVESLFSAIKRTLGHAVHARQPKNQEKTAILKVLTYNIEVIGRQIKIVFYVIS
ncbi:IS5 family transposase [archaeon]|nr:IS5 family transposase [archaeon]